MDRLEHLRPLFREEAADLLEELESACLDLEAAPGECTLVDRIFRALHTIKGSANMYGFTEAAAVAHELEDVYATARTNRGSVEPAAIELTLGAKDCITGLILSPDGADLSGFSAMAREITEACRGSADRAQVDTAAADPCAAFYRIELRPGADALTRGLSITGILEELDTLGELSVEVEERIPPLEILEVGEVYVNWRLGLRTDRSRDEVEAALMFLDPSEFVITEETDRTLDTLGVVTPGGKVEHGEDFVRVAAPKLDRLVNLVGELVTAHAGMGKLAVGSGDETLQALSEEIGRLTAEMRESVLDIRMVPIGTVFARMKRHVRDLAIELGKNVDVVMGGGDTELDKTVIDRIEQPLIHILRNSMDHGIETPEERAAAGKPEKGSIHVSATQAGGAVLIEIVDDGRGLDAERIREKAVRVGLIAEDEELSEEDAYALLFRAGFSTTGTVTNLSGRGVGLDVVSRVLQELQGTVSISPRKAGGTRVVMRLPLTLAIVEALLVSVEEERYMIPLGLVEECVEVGALGAWGDHGRTMLDVRGEIVPFVRLREFFGIAGERCEDELAVIVKVGRQRLGLVVDSVEDQIQAVVKSLGRHFGRADGLSGASILGNGTIALVLDASELLRLHVTDEGGGRSEAG